MTDTRAYDLLADQLTDRGVDVARVERRLASLVIETPSWGYGDAGTRFGVFPQPGRPRDVFEKVDDAAEVHRLTGTAGAVAFHFPGTRSTTTPRCGRTSRGTGCASGRSTRTSSRTPTTGSARSPTPTPACGPGPWSACSSASGSRPRSARRPSRCGSPTAPTTPARTTCGPAAARLLDGLGQLYAALPAEQELLVEYKLFEPGFYATDLRRLGLGGPGLPAARRARPRARRPRPPRPGHERRADRGPAAGRGPARRLPLQQPQVRRRRPDRRLGEPVRAVPDLLRAARRRRRAAAPDDRPVAQRRAEGRGDGAVAWSSCRRPT